MPIGEACVVALGPSDNCHGRGCRVGFKLVMWHLRIFSHLSSYGIPVDKVVAVGHLQHKGWVDGSYWERPHFAECQDW